MVGSDLRGRRIDLALWLILTIPLLLTGLHNLHWFTRGGRLRAAA